MDEEAFKAIAAQLRQPHGEYGIQVGEKMNEGNLHINLNTLEALDPRPGDNILEIGMGNGFFVKDIVSADKTIQYSGCDFSEIMVAEARKINAPFIERGQVNFYFAEAKDLPFSSAIFDTVFSVNTLYFWNDPSAILSEIRRVLKPKGKIVLAIRPKFVMQHYPFVQYGFTMFTKDDLAALLTNNGFAIIDIAEKPEPEILLNGEKVRTATLLVVAGN